MIGYIVVVSEMIMNHDDDPGDECDDDDEDVHMGEEVD